MITVKYHINIEKKYRDHYSLDIFAPAISYENILHFEENLIFSQWFL